MGKRAEKKVPPDGGWGWFIVLGSSLINLSTRAIEPSFGLLFGDLLKRLGVATTGASIVISTLDAIINFSGLFVGPLVKRLSYRKVAIIGSILSSSALLLTSFANSMIHILITFSLIGGVGFGLATASTLVGINSYFSKRKGQAVGLAMAGTALGFMAMPQIVSLLLIEFEFQSTMLILGALSLHAIVGACLFQPVKWHLQTVIPDEEKLHGEEEARLKLLSTERKFSLNFNKPLDSNISRKFSGPTLASMNLGVRGDHSSSAPVLMKGKNSTLSHVSLADLTGSSCHIALEREIQEEDEDDRGLEIKIKKTPEIKVENEDSGCWDKFCKLFDLDLLSDGIYLNILYGMSISMVAEMNFKLIIPFFLGNLGYTKTEIAMSLSLMAIADITARVLIPPILDRLTYSRRVTLMVGSLLVSLCRSLLAEQTQPIPLMVILIVHGFFRGVTLINNPLVLSEYASGDNFPAVLGLSMVAKGVFIVILGPICGYIRDTTQSYPIYIHFQSLMILSMVIAWTIEMVITSQKKKVSTVTPLKK